MAGTTTNEVRSYSFQTIKKFPTITFEIVFLQTQQTDSLEARNLVSKVLPQVVAAFPTKIATKSYFSDLYAARVYSGVQRRGDKHEISFQFVFTDPQMVHDDNYQMADILTCIKRVLLEPQLEDGVFIASVVDIENKLMQARIANMDDDKATYAQSQLLKNMFVNTPLAVRAYGELENYPALTNKKVYETYQQMLQEDTMIVSVVGDVDQGALQKELESVLIDVQADSKPLMNTPIVLPEHKEVVSITELQPVKQARLHIGYRIPATVHTSDYFIHQVATDILGGSGSSKLFQNVREKASLAYSINAAMDSFAGAAYIYAGVDRDKIQRAHDIIQEQLAGMREGQISAEELSMAQDNLIHRLSMAQDSAFGLIRIQKQLAEFPSVKTLDDWIAAIRAVSIDEVVSAMKTWQEDTVFILTDETDGKGER